MTGELAPGGVGSHPGAIRLVANNRCFSPGEDQSGRIMGNVRSSAFTHRPRWMKLHLSVFSCITPKLVVYFFLFSLSLLSFLSLAPHSCVSGLLKGFSAKIPVILIFPHFSPPLVSLVGICSQKHTFESLSCGFDFLFNQFNWHMSKMCNNLTPQYHRV